MNTHVSNDQPGVRSVKQGPVEKQPKTLIHVSLAVISVALLLLGIFFAATGTKAVDITALQGKGEGIPSQAQAASATR